jgi:hypothetical protein
MARLRPIALLVVVAALWAGTASNRASEWTSELSSVMGLPVPAAGSSELRIWVSNFTIPDYLYVIRSGPTGVTGERFAYVRFQHSEDRADRATERSNKRENRYLLRVLREESCNGRVKQSDDVAWCAAPTKGRPDWAKVLESLNPAQLWDLPDEKELESRRDPRMGCTTFDGVSEDVELISGERQHRFSYSNPDGGCCIWDECRVADNVLKVVQAIE